MFHGMLTGHVSGSLDTATVVETEDMIFWLVVTIGNDIRLVQVIALTLHEFLHD